MSAPTNQRGGRACVTAVVPAAGLGSRMLPLTKAMPKEMFPAGRKPIIQRIVEEAIASGLRRVCIVIREGKEIIRDYFVARQPAARKRTRGVEELEELVSRCELSFVFQQKPRGLGDALLCAREFVGTTPFVLMVPDQLMLAREPAPAQLLRRFRDDDRATVLSSLVRLPKEEVPYFAGARGLECAEGERADEFAVSRLRTEEETRRAFAGHDYELRGFGRTIYPPEIFDYLGAEFADERTGEVDLIKTFEACAGKIAHRAVILEGTPLDLGTFAGYQRYLPRLWEDEG